MGDEAAVPVYRLEIEARAGLQDARGLATAEKLEAWLGFSGTRVRTRKVFLLDLDLSADEATRVLEALVDPVAEVGALGLLDDPAGVDAPAAVVEVGFLPGVTDVVGNSTKRAAMDCLGRALEGKIYTAVAYSIWGLDDAQLKRAVAEVLHNPMIEAARVDALPRSLNLSLPRAGAATPAKVEAVPMREMNDEQLMALSDSGTLALNLKEMRAIQAHFVERGRDPWDAEIECLAQTWSEHCKHKIFASPIAYIDPQGERHEIERGLFRSFIRGTTEAIAQQRLDESVDPSDKAFLVSVFHDNAGVVRFTERDHLVYKVETHNSPSALDPYGGAMTGIVGVNRDSFGTGRGADLLTNVWGYCFGEPRYAGKLPKGLMHPRRIRDGVHEGVIDGGNHSGIPYSRGFELFDDRYAGKPLVYCGTVAVMPVTTAGKPTEEKYLEPGDRVVMVGGRIGKDGIHGATFSSAQLDETAPVQAVQIGDPITQKMMWDLLTEARELGLYSGMTDNGAGGLSSSIGEMAEATGGAHLDLANAPLKYPGLQPWEILISEAQERMSLAIRPQHLDAFMALARRYEVEASDLGEFTDDGRFMVCYGELEVVDLPLSFLHEGVPLPTLEATWSPPARQVSPAPELSLDAVPKELLGLLAQPNVASKEERSRHYDHEVKGLSVIKPFVGERADVPSTATVMRTRHGRPEGVVLAEGIHPHYSDIDTDAMAKASVDEAVRRVLCAGARYDRLSALDNFCWPDPVVSERTPDGRHKLAQLVRACQGLDASCRAFGMPLISGKDSMKNDAHLDGVKISIPPTLLISVMGQMPDVSRALTLEPRAAGDILLLLGHTRDERGASEFSRMHKLELERVPQTDLAANVVRYRAFCELRDAGLIRSAHALGIGGLALGLAHMAMSTSLRIQAKLDALAQQAGSLGAALFSESTGRMLVSVRAKDLAAVRGGLDSHGVIELGAMTAADAGGLDLTLRTTRVSCERDALAEAFKGALRGL